MTTPTGSPDWNVPINVHTRALALANVQLAGGAATVGPFDVTGYTGILVEHLAITADASFGTLSFVFDDPSLALFTLPTYVVNWRGDLPIKLNVPVLGPRVTLQYQGTTNGHQSQVSLVAHTGGGAASYGRNSTLLVSKTNGALAPGTADITETSLIREGPAVFCVQTGAGNVRAYVRATDHLGGVWPIADIGATSAAGGFTIPLWIPPYPIDVKVDNNAGVAIGYTATLTLGRS